MAEAGKKAPEFTLTNAEGNAVFLIDERGNLVREWRKVKVEGHVEEVLASLGGQT